MKKLFHSQLVRGCGITVSALVLVYVLLYSGLSIAGRYQPISVGIDQVKGYAWAPFGFYDPDHAWRGSGYAVRHPSEKTGGWSRFMVRTFYPLWLIDARYIHPFTL
jgi:hypothetical protein